MEIKTPIFKGANRNPAQLIGTAEGWIDPAEVCGITSGIHVVPGVRDVPNGNKELSGGLFAELLFRGGARLLAFGTPKSLREQIKMEGVKQPAQRASDE